MACRHPAPLPAAWLMTDERMGDALWPALHRLPRGGGVIFRHYGLSLAERRTLFAQVAQVARARRLVLVRAGAHQLGRGEAGVHNRRGRGLITFAVHDLLELRQAERMRADAVLISPVFTTRSHARARRLGRTGLLRLASQTQLPVIALGGMTVARFRGLKPHGIHGWAAIDAWTTPRQKRKAVPT